MVKNKIIGGVLAIFGFVVAFAISSVLVSKPTDVEAGASHNVQGYAWSETIGWISFNSDDFAGSPDYGVAVDVDTGNISGHAWSEHIGWISFNVSESGTCPVNALNPDCQPKLDRITGDVTGWARALAPKDNTNAGGWDGWISLSGHTNPVKVVGCNWTGWAWGSDVVGWISFNNLGQGGTVTGTGDACVSTAGKNLTSTFNPSTTFTVGQPTNLLATVSNTGLLDVTESFTDNFTYRWGTLGAWLNIGESQHASGLNASQSADDTVSFTPTATGNDLYIQHCVDSNGVVDEGAANESDNCTQSGPFTVNDTVSGCALSVEENCAVEPSNVGDVFAGTCVNGTSGACQYRCDAVNTWTEISNTCAAAVGGAPTTLTANPNVVNSGQSSTLSWLDNTGAPAGANGCAITVGGNTTSYNSANLLVVAPITTETSLSTGSLTGSSIQFNLWCPDISAPSGWKYIDSATVQVLGSIHER